MKKTVVFFDFFGVISTEIAPIWFRRYFNDAQADCIKSDIVAKADLGLLTEEEMFRQISLRMNIPAEQIAQEWYDLVTINTPLVAFIRQLKETYPVYLLSNAIGPFLHRILKEHELYPLFDDIFISSEIGISKPDRAFFDHVLAALRLSAEQVVMIDDNPSNLKGAALAGIDGIHFFDNPSFKTEFDRYYNTATLIL